MGRGLGDQLIPENEMIDQESYFMANTKLE